MSDQRDLELLYEVGCFRFVERTWKQFYNADFANNAEHGFRVAWTALLIARREGVGNHEKILKMALVHDLPESRAGDVHYLSRLYTERNEDLAITDMFDKTSFGAELIELWREYEAKSTIEAKIVKDADQLDVDLELQEQASRGNPLKVDFKVSRAAVFGKLFTATGRQLWEQLQNSNPNDWHLRGRNRLTSGDWKPAESSPQDVPVPASTAETKAPQDGWRS